MSLISQNISGCFTFEMIRYTDSRGFNMELFNQNAKEIHFNIEQVNISLSSKNVIRGLHYSLGNHNQNMIVTCLSGGIRDVLVDIRIGSPSFGTILEFDINATSDLGIFVPAGVAHGYLVKQENTLIHYLLSKSYNPKFEETINPISSGFSINWDTANPILSTKDATAKSYEEMNKLGLISKFNDI